VFPKRTDGSTLRVSFTERPSIYMKKKPTARAFVLAIIAGEIDRVRKMQAAGASVSEPDQYGWLPIHRAAANDRDEIIRLLIEWGSPLEATGTEEWTPLHLASVSRSSHAVAALLKAGANIHARSVYGATPLHLAVGPTVTNELLETVRLLVSAGAAIDALDETGKTPLDEAREIGNQDLQMIFENAQRP
jgi:ankyrin repeat protein